LSGDERIRDPYLGGGEHGDEMTFGDRPLNVDTRRRPMSQLRKYRSFDNGLQRPPSVEPLGMLGA
jgi:hypothetical protein